MFKLKEKIFGLFGYYLAVDDINKIGGKGFMQRFTELLAGDLDDNELLANVEYQKNIIDSTTILEKYINLKLEQYGFVKYVSTEYSILRNILTYLDKFYNVKGTKKGYEMLFRAIGIDGVIEIKNYENNAGFDNDNKTFDVGMFDLEKGYCCQKYSIEIISSTLITSSISQAIKNIIKLNEPINAELIYCNYNGNNIIENGSFNDSFNDSFDN